MIGKIMKGTSFSGCVCYVLNEEKARLLGEYGVDGTPEQMAEQFELQTLLNDKVKNTVGHISLSFSKEDGTRLRTDDAFMLQIAKEYMEKMSINNTQYIIARHTDRAHPHCHIVFNRVDNDGKTVSDKNDRYRNEKVCKILTARYRLHFANGKDHINKERLRPYDRAKHNIYKALNEELPKATDWNELKESLFNRGIEMTFKVSRTTQEIQGVKFGNGKYTFSGSKIGREFSYMNIDYQLRQNAFDESFKNRQTVSQVPREEQQRTVASEHSNDTGLGLGLFSGIGSSSNIADMEANQEMAEILRKKKKAKLKRGFRL
jgi:hypothetical protein